MERFAQTDSWKMMQILHASFRTLAPPGRPLGAMAAGQITPMADHDEASYRLMEN